MNHGRRSAASALFQQPASSADRRKDFYALTEKGLDLIPILLNIVLWSAKYGPKSYKRRRKEFVARLNRSAQKVSGEVKELVRNGGCIFPQVNG
jgi:DNA-binding MarR family transcriptional regulator